MEMVNYLNNAGAGMMSVKTIEIVAEYLNYEVAVGAYQAEDNVQGRVREFYERVCSLINAPSIDDIAYMDSASRGWNMVLAGAVLPPKATIVTLASEFGTNQMSLYALAVKNESELKIIECDESGAFSLAAIERELKNGAAMVAISHVAAHGSIVNPVVEVGELTKKYGALYVVDGCQAMGQVAADVQEIGCDVYTATGRKWLRGPRGTGFVYIRESAPFYSPQMDLSTGGLVLDNDYKAVELKLKKGARQFELWEKSVACLLGLSNAIDEYLAYGRQNVAQKIKNHAEKMRRLIADNSNLGLLGQVVSESGIVGFYVKNPAREELVKKRFKDANIGMSVVEDGMCPLHFPRGGGRYIFRLSPHYYTESLVVDLACEIIAEI